MSNPRLFENTATITKYSQYEDTILTIRDDYCPILSDQAYSLLINPLKNTPVNSLSTSAHDAGTKEQTLSTSQIKNKSLNSSLVDARDEKEIAIENSFYKIPKRSAEAWREADLKKNPNVQAMILPSYHPVEKVLLRKDKLGFFKHNFRNSSMSELETTASRFYYLFSRGLTPKMHTIYDKLLDIVGVVSKILPGGFKSLSEEPLTMADLKIEALDNKKITRDELVAIYEKYCRNATVKLAERKDDEPLLLDLPSKQVTVSVSDLKHFEIARGNAITLTLSYFFEEDDLHRGNLAKNGKRIDFDMSLWSIFSHFKYADKYALNPNKLIRSARATQFEMTEKDILQFPVLTDAFPFHWPALSQEGYLKYMARLANNIAKVTGNVYTESDKAAYTVLAKNPVFIYYKYETLIRLCLMPETTYTAIAEVEINNEVTLPDHNTSIIQDITEHLKTRTTRCIELLTSMSDFRDFMKQHGQTVLNSFINELDERNKLLETRLQKRKVSDPNFATNYPEFIKQRIDLEKVKENFTAFNEKCLTTSQHEAQQKSLFSPNSTF